MPGGFCISWGDCEAHTRPFAGHMGEMHMSHDTPQEHISKKRVVYTRPGVDAVVVRRDEPYRAADGRELAMDLYYPPDSQRAARAHPS
jgi:hypothetical protein